MNIPALEVPKAAVWFYHSYVVQHEAELGVLDGLPFKLDPGYAESEDEAKTIYANDHSSS